MAEIDLATLISPISEGEPCGPDLDAAGDPDYMNFIVNTENLLPNSFFKDGKPFDRSTIDFAAEFAAIRPLLERTRDIRLIVILAKLAILNRDLATFEVAVGAIQELLKERWDDVHPRGEEGAFSARIATLETLDDMPLVIFPLQYVPLARHLRLGDISYRNYMMASGEVPPRDGESTHDLTTLESALMEVDLAALTQALGRIDVLSTTLAEIRNICVDRAGFEHAAKLERLPALVDKIRSLLNSFVVKRDPSAALAVTPAGEALGAGSEAQPASGEVRSLADVAAALAAIADYFVRKEPSNPALLLVRQAEQLMGKSFFEVMQILLPAQVEHAAIYIGKEQMLQLPLGRLSELASSSAGSPSANGGDAATEDDTASGGETAIEAETGSEATTEAETRAGGDIATGGDAANGAGKNVRQRRFEAKTRADAVRLLEQIGAFYRAVEPSNPLPYLTDRARDLAGRDFLSLLKHVLPEFGSNT